MQRYRQLLSAPPLIAGLFAIGLGFGLAACDETAEDQGAQPQQQQQPTAPQSGSGG